MILVVGTLLVPTNVPTKEICDAGGYSWINFLITRPGGRRRHRHVHAGPFHNDLTTGINAIWIGSTPEIIRTGNNSGPHPSRFAFGRGDVRRERPPRRLARDLHEMNTIAIDPAPMTENIDMSTPDKAGIAFRALCSLVFAIGLLAGLPGTASAQTGFCEGTIDFCNNAPDGNPWYDNAQPPVYGCFTDLIRFGWRPPGTATSSSDLPKSTSSRTWHRQPNPPNPAGRIRGGIHREARDMRVELLRKIGAHIQRPRRDVDHDPGPPGKPTPMINSWGLTATIWFDNVTGAPNPYGSGGRDNSKAVGIVTNYNPADKTGLFLGLFDAGNTESMRLMKFDASPDHPQGGHERISNNPTVLVFKSLAVHSILWSGMDVPRPIRLRTW